MPEPSQPLLPPGTGPKLARALLSVLAAMLWFTSALICGSGSAGLFGDAGSTNEVFAWIAVAGALTTGVAFGLRMASIAVESVPGWVPWIERWTWVALPVWFGLAVLAARI